ncbi:MAG: putative selenium-dependent hydroxylase accessory protein YqeC [Caldithrix sp.]|nr:MAG: putative selenium-dependent hydroxylase accessory protein YqeC [Caldithrix sp.]
MPFYSLLDPPINSFKGQIISVIGGGGKSSLLKKIGQELVKLNLKVILTTTTKIEPFPNTAVVLLQGRGEDIREELTYMLDELKIIMVAKKRYHGNKLVGVNPEVVQKFKKYANIVLVEADGARQRPFKTHMPHEPVIPAATDKVIIVIGSEIVHKPLNDETVHRADLFAKKWNMELEAKLTPKIIAKELLSTAGYIGKIPLTSNVAIFINKTDLNLDRAKSLAEYLMKKCDYPIFLGSIKNNSIVQVNPHQTTERFDLV